MARPYAVGVDAGTTRTAAGSTADGDDPQPVQLGDHGFAVPTTVAAGDGGIEIGDAAERLALRRPEAVARYFKSRVGDEVPVVLDGAPWPAALLLAKVQRWAVDRAEATARRTADVTVLTHPAAWGTFRLDVLRQAAVQAGIADPVLLPEPAAAATHCAHGGTELGATYAVYDFGGGTFDAAVVRREEEGYVVLGTPQGVERVGGLDVDQAVLAFVDNAIGGVLSSLGDDDVGDIAELRRRCCAAKEALAVDASTSIAVRLRTVQHDVRITRDDLRQMVEPLLGETVVALRRSLESAGVQPSDLEAVLLVGGSSRLPLVGETITAALDGVAVIADPQPKLAIALGAARHGAALLAPPARPAAPAAPAASSAALAPSPAAAAAAPPAVAAPAPAASTGSGAPQPSAPVAVASAPATDPGGAPAAPPAVPETAAPRPAEKPPVAGAPAASARTGLVLALGTAVLLAVAVAVAVAGVGAPARDTADRGVLELAGQDGAATVELDLAEPFEVVVPANDDAVAVRVAPSVGEAPVYAADPAPIQDGRAEVDLSSDRYLVGGRFHLDVELLDLGGDVVETHVVDARTAHNGLLTVPGVVTVVGLLVVGAAGEAALRSARRRARGGTGDVVRLVIVGAVTGALLVAVVGLLGGTEPSLRTAAVAAAVTALGAGLLGATARRRV